MKIRQVNAMETLAPFGGVNFNHGTLSRSRSHRHDFHEIFLVEKGVARHTMNDSSRIVETNTLMSVPPGTVHVKEAVEVDCSMYNIAFTTELVADVAVFSGLNFTHLSSRTAPIVKRLNTNERKRFIHLFEEGTRSLIRQTPEARASLRLIILTICVKFLLSVERTERDDAPPLPDWLEGVVIRMEKTDNYRKGLPFLRKIACKSQEHLIRSFKRHLRQTPTEYVNSLRLERAASLLATTESPVYWIAEEVGFSNLSHFHHLYKRRFGVSPAKYRQKMGTLFET